MRLALDTQAYSDFCRGSEKIRTGVQQAEQVALPLIVLAELRAGFRASSRGAGFAHLRTCKAVGA